MSVIATRSSASEPLVQAVHVCNMCMLVDFEASRRDRVLRLFVMGV